MKLCFASNNRHKLDEVQALLPPGITLVSLQDIGVTEDPPENEMTLDENSYSKAWYVFSKAGINCFADDTGLEVEALNGEPGVYSARYAGMQRDAAANMRLLLDNLKGEENRKARFRTVVTLLIEGQQPVQFDGVVEGHIIEEPRGSQGFGYDPIFVPNGFDRTFAEMSAEEKNQLSHRGRAIAQLVDYLREREGARGAM